MGLFQNLTTEGLEESKDVLGGGSFDPVSSGVYDCTIKLAYVGSSQSSKATCINVVAVADGKEVREQVWVTNRNGENFYADKEDKSKRNPLPGFTLINDLCLLTTGQPLSDQDAETKVVKLYDFNERKEVPTEVQCLTALHGQPVKLGILRQIVNKQKKDANGVYKDTNETRTENVIDKVFHAETARTVQEYMHEVETPEFMTAWAERNTGKDRNRAKEVTDSGIGQAGTGMPGAAGAAKKNLFGK